MPKLHLLQLPQMRQAINQLWQKMITELCNNRIRYQTHLIELIQITHTRHHFLKCTLNLGDGIVTLCITTSHTNKELIHPRRQQTIAKTRLTQMHTMSLNSHMLEPCLLGRLNHGNQLFMKGNFGAGQNNTLPAVIAPLLGQHLLKYTIRLGLQIIHGAFDHAVHTLKVTAKLKCDRNVIIVRIQSHT